MRHFGWVVGLGPPLLLAAGALLAPPGLVAGATKSGCPTSFLADVGASTRGAPIDAQLRLRTTLTSNGVVAGRRLQFTTAAGPRTVSLAAEAFASQPVANVVVYGQNDPSTGSTVRATDLQTGCDYALWQTADAVRSAVIAPDLHSLFVHGVTQTTRADLGLARINLQTLAATTVVAPLAADPDYGPTFATLLRWSLDGDGLAVQSCGTASCRTRVLDAATGAISTFAGEQGQLVGLTRGTIAVFDPCTDLPCGLHWIDRATGRASAVDIDGYSATLEEDSMGPVLKVSTSAGTKEFRP